MGKKMFKRIAKVITSIALCCAMLPGLAYAAEAIQLEETKVESAKLQVKNGDELIENGSFDDGLDSWTVNDPCEIEVIEEDGNNILKVTGRTLTGSGPRQDITGDVVIGGTYKLTAKIKYDNPNSPNTTIFNMCIYNGSHYVNNDSIQIMGSGTITKGQWGTVEGTFTIKDGTDISQSAIFLETNWVQNPNVDTNLMDFYVDDVSVVAQNVNVTQPGRVQLGGSAKTVGNSNPLVDHKFGADPFAMVYDGRVYIYMTNDSQEYAATNNGSKDNSYGNINTINVISSADMVNWTDHGAIPVAGRNNAQGAAKWASCSWAPAAAHKTIDGKEKFFLYFADSGSGVGVLTADSPIGPFTDPLGKALVAPGSVYSQGVVWLFDPAVFVDDDGEGYLYYGGGVPNGQANNPKTSRMIKLSDDMIHLEGNAITLDAPAIFEDSGIHKFGDKYYYSYCSNFDQHAAGYPGQGNICYMVSDEPLGEYEYVGEVFSNPATFFGVGGNNHHAFFEFNGEYYLTYHAQTLGKALGKANGYRSTHIDKVEILDDGTILPITGTYKGISQLEYVDPYQRLEGEMFAWNKGINTEKSSQPGGMVESQNMQLMDIQNGEWTAIAGVDFGEKGACELRANVAGLAEEDGYIEVRLDSVDGEIAGIMDVYYSEGEYEVLECDIVDAVGVHDVYFVYVGAEEGDLMNVDYWEFVEDDDEPKPTPTPEPTPEPTTTPEPTPEPTPTPVEKLPYVDVEEGNWFYSPVAFTYYEKLMTGMDPTHFGPYNNLSRAQFALILHRMEGEEAVDADKSFGDITGDEWYGPAVLWAAKNGIVTGYTDGNFGPADMITREQMALMMYRYAKYLKLDVEADADYSEFKDAESVSEFAEDAMKWAVGNEIITGKENGTIIDPQGNTARAEAAAIIQRFMEGF